MGRDLELKILSLVRTQLCLRFLDIRDIVRAWLKDDYFHMRPRVLGQQRVKNIQCGLQPRLPSGLVQAISELT